MMPPGMDPDDLIRAQGAGAITSILGQARPMVDLLWSRETEGRNFDSPERKAALDKALREAIARIPDESTRNHYAAAIREKRWDLFGGRRGAGRITPSSREAGVARRSGFGAGAPSAPAAPTRASAVATSDVGEALLEAMVLALCARYPDLVARIESRLERLVPLDPAREPLIHDLLTGAATAPGRAALETLMSDPHVKAAPAIIRHQPPEDVAVVLINAFDKLDSHRAARAEIERAAREITGLADEGLTWRVSQMARARHAADHPSIEDSSDLGEDSSEMQGVLDRFLKDEIWRKR